MFFQDVRVSIKCIHDQSIQVDAENEKMEKKCLDLLVSDNDGPLV